MLTILFIFSIILNVSNVRSQNNLQASSPIQLQLFPETSVHCSQIGGLPVKKSLFEETKQKISFALLGHKHSEETRKKISIANKGHKFSTETRMKMSEAKKNRKLSIETKMKMSLSHKGKKPYEMTDGIRKKMSIINKGKKLSEETKIKISLGMKGKKNALGHKHSEEHSKKISLANKGSKNWNWKGGISQSYIKHLSERKWHNIRKQVYKRDNYTCQICQIQYKDKNGKGMNVHHIIPYRISQDDNLTNLITLCDSCHIKEERKYCKSLEI